MVKKKFMKGNEAAAEAAIRAGCDGFFFYPLTPSSEIGEYMAAQLDDRGGNFVQAESEISAINMVFGAASSGARAMTATSGVGYSLMTECISYMVGAQVPAVIVDVMRGGPGLGSLEPTQADYNQVVKGSGHGGHILPVFAPSSAQEVVDHVTRAFEVAEEYRTPVVVLYDAYTGQVMESVSFPETFTNSPANDWCFDNTEGREKRVVRSGYGVKILPHWEKLFIKYDHMKDTLQEYQEYQTEDADIILVGFGIVGRICKSVVQKARAEGIKLGLIRPVKLSPFPTRAFEKFKGSKVKFLTIEMSYGLMKDDVALALGNSENASFFRNKFGSLLTVKEILEEVRRMDSEVRK